MRRKQAAVFSPASSAHVCAREEGRWDEEEEEEEEEKQCAWS